MKMRTRAAGNATAGFTLTELLIVATILGLMLGWLGMIGRSSDHAYRTGTLAAQLEAQASIAIEKIVADLQPAGFDMLSPDLLPDDPDYPGFTDWSDWVEYAHPSGMIDGEVPWDHQRRLAFELEAGELPDGRDNNGNGLVDEGVVVLTENVGDPTERRRVLVHWVSQLLEGEELNGEDDNGNGLIDERGFVVERAGETLIVRLTLQRANPERQLLSRTARTSTRLRN